MTTSNTIAATAVPEVPTAQYNHSIGYLRAFIVALVVAHHAALAYHSSAPPPSASLVALPRWWEAFPVVDAQRWTGFNLLVGFNETFFMSLMFFLSGLFVWHGLKKKGSAKFLRDRLLRLGIPFIVAAAVVAPLAYYPAYLQTPGHAGIAGFWRQWLSLGQWPAGPAWFVWVLLVFDCIAALLFALAPRWGETLGRITSGASRRPAVFFALLFAISAMAYIPMALTFHAFQTMHSGPFTFQTSRILHYLAYFLIAVGVGNKWHRARTALHPTESWHAAGLFGWPRLWFWLDAAVLVIALTAHAQSQGWAIASEAGFALSCAASSFAFLALFIRFARSRSPLFSSLSANSYGIYLLHYAFVSWLQYAILPPSFPAVAKFA